MALNGFEVLQERGFVQQVTDEAAVRALFADANKPVVLYAGYDPTASSLHVGHLFPTMALMHLERLGHKPIVVMGGGTAMVGDPSGKTEMRQMLSEDDISANALRLKAQFARLLDFGTKSVFVNNGEWIWPLNYVQFLRDIGRHFSVNRMLSAEAYKLRLERGLSFIEFNYQLLQAFDFAELFKRYECVLQVGGDDQWGNILAGVDLTRRLHSTTVHGLTFPLQLTATGEKMGKTAAGAVWLDPELLKPYDYYQYWINTHDADVVRMLGFFTFLPMNEVNAVKDLGGRELNIAKAILAYEATVIVHGEEAARAAHGAAQAAFGGRALDPNILPTSHVPRSAQQSASDIPTVEISAAQLAGAPVTLKQLLVGVTGLVKSGNEAMTKIKEGSVSFEPGGVMTDPSYTLQTSAFKDGALLVRVGKKNVRRLTLV